MNKIAPEKRIQILHLLVEGSSMRSASRIADVSINTVTKMLIDAGTACRAYHDAHVRNVKAKRVQVDEIWSFCYAKERNVKTAKAAPEGAGDVWTWTAIDADSKLMISWLAGGRDSEYAQAFMCDVRDRLANRVQLTSDGHKAYLQAVEEAFGDDIDYAMLEKLFGQAPEGRRRYSPPVIVGTRTRCCTGNPDPDHVSTSYAERQNLTMRMHMRRFTRLTNGFSKKIENHEHSLSLYFFYYNFVRLHQTLGVSPAMAADVSDHLWSMEELIAMIDARDQKSRSN